MLSDLPKNVGSGKLSGNLVDGSVIKLQIVKNLIPKCGKKFDFDQYKI